METNAVKNAESFSAILNKTFTGTKEISNRWSTNPLKGLIMKPNYDDGKTHPNEKTKPSSNGSDNFSVHQDSVENEPTEKANNSPARNPGK
ncbi:MAG: hypothetical protein JWO78_1473 [Micavibrio sp.]|nr:hypothetical protein [Micavibrio sp.]